jgi:endonuclease/exonuclease/phosphatase family metal-dependent hydrolase
VRLISLNIWGGKVYAPLLDFVQKYAGNIDIFCFQEVFYTESGHKISGDTRANIYQEIAALLLEFQGLFAHAQDGYDMDGKVNFHLSCGLAMFIKNNISLIHSGSKFVHGERNSFASRVYTNMPRNLQFVQFSTEGRDITICNFHGLWTAAGKGDTKSRIVQSEKTSQFIHSVQGEKVLCGDFNLLPDTKSLAILERGMKNLIKEYRITSTRTHLYTKEQKFADYILLSKETPVKDFRVLEDVVSDHSPLLLEF